MDMVSVIIPMYNSERYIGQTLESVLCQTYKYIEIIIIDDGSNDKSSLIIEKLVEEYGDEKIKYYYQENSGVSVARNNGINKASGKYIAFLDSDDLWEKSKIEKQINLMEKKGAKFSYCGVIYWFENNNLKLNHKKSYKNSVTIENTVRHELWQLPWWPSEWIIEKKLIKDNKIMFTPNCNWGEDIEFLIKILSFTKAYFLKENLLIYRIRDNSLTTGIKLLESIKDIYVWERIVSWIKNNKDRIVCKDADKIIDIINGYVIPRQIIYRIYKLVYKRNFELVCTDEDVKIIRNYIDSNYVKQMKLNNGLKSIKLYILYWLIRKKVNKKLKK